MKRNKIHTPKTVAEFNKLDSLFKQRGYVAYMPGKTVTIPLDSPGGKSEAAGNIQAQYMSTGTWSKSPIAQAAFSIDAKERGAVSISGNDGKPLGAGYIPWGAGDNIPSVVPALAWSLPYTSAPLNYCADLICGLGPRLMYRFGEGDICEFRDAGKRLKAAWDSVREERSEEPEQLLLDKLHGNHSHNESEAEKEAREAYEAWGRTWNGYDIEGDDGTTEHVPGAKQFLEENNLDLHMSGCAQDDVMLDIYFPTVGFQRGRKGRWAPKIVRVGQLSATSTRLEKMNEYRHINHVYFSDRWRTKGMGTVAQADTAQAGVVMYPCAMPQNLLSDLRYIVESNQRTRIKDRPTWVVCPTYYPSLLKNYYPQPSWWSIFPSKAFDFASTILYDKATARENGTSWGKIFYISLDYLKALFADAGIDGDEEAKQKVMDELDNEIQSFLQKRENHGKMMRQFMWQGPDGKDHKNVEIVDITEATKDAVNAGKDELEMATNVIFLALRVDPRLVGVPMVSSSNGGTFQREMSLLKAQQMSPKQRLYLSFLNAVARFNEWDEHAVFVVKQQVLTTLDASKTGTMETAE